jgi:hypothetical protein
MYILKKIKFSLVLSFLISIIIFFGIYNIILLSKANSQSQLPVCTSPGGLLTLQGNWSSGYIPKLSSRTGVLSVSNLIEEDTPQVNLPLSFKILRGRWLNIEGGGIILGNPVIHFNTGAYNTRGNYNKYLFKLTTSTNIFQLIWDRATPTPTTTTIFTVRNSGDFILNNGNLFVLKGVHIGTTTASNNNFLLIATSPTFMIASNNNLSSNYLKIEFTGNNLNNLNIRFKDNLNFIYHNNNNPLITFSNGSIFFNATTNINNVQISQNTLRSQIIESNTLCLNNDCRNNWPQGGGGNISGSGATNNLVKWISSTVIGTSSIVEYSNSNLIEAVGKKIAASQFCFRTQNGNLDCLNSWPTRPRANVKREYTTGINYPIPQSFLNSFRSNSQEANVAWIDPFIRPGAISYDNNIGNGYPYISLHYIIQQAGIDPNDSYSTRWFPIAYSYRQPYTNFPSTIYIVEGDNINPWKRYTKTTSSPNGLDPNNPNDVFVYCHYQFRGAIYVTSNKDFCDEVRRNQRQGYTIVSFTYAQRNSNIRGYVVFDLRLEPANYRRVCTKRDYLNTLSISSWGSYNILNTRYGNFRDPNLDNDPCYDVTTGRRVNLHSLLMGRFRVRPYPTTNTNSPDYIPPSEIDSFLSDPNADFKVVIKEAGVAELINY